MYRLSLVVILSVLANFSARAEIGPVTMPIEVLKAWIPIGFDNNDRAQVLIDGVLPSTCFRVGPYSTKVDSVTKTISLQQNADTYAGICLQMVIPFTQTIELGNLEAGNYTLTDATSGRVLGTLPVVRSTSQNIDDYVYANVRDVVMTKDAATGHTTVTGFFDLPSRCSKFKVAVVRYYPETIVVQPILQSIGAKVCGKTLERSEFKVALKDGLKGTYLLHVRSMNGRAINRLVDVE